MCVVNARGSLTVVDAQCGYARLNSIELENQKRSEISNLRRKQCCYLAYTVDRPIYSKFYFKFVKIIYP